MDSRVSSNYTHDVHGPSTTKKRSTEKLIPGERKTDLKVYACSDINLAKFLSYDVMFWGKNQSAL